LIKQQESKNNNNMRTIKILAPALLIVVLALIFTSNQIPMDNDYERTWKKVDSLNNLRQPQSALTLVDEIYAAAKSENNTPQLIKANLYRIKLMADFEEDFLEKAIDQIKGEIETSVFPEKQILHSILAELYWHYYQANRWKILNRTTTIGFEQEDIKTWDAKKLLDIAIENYQLSLAEPAALQAINIEKFKVILIEKKETQTFRPTLFDFLAWRALDFYRNDESGLTQAAGRFELNNVSWFMPARRFATLNVEQPELISNDYYAVKVLQQLLAFHLNDKSPQALIDADLFRLDFVYNKSILSEKDSLYLSALTNMEQQFNTSSYSTSVNFEIAKFLVGQGAKYKPMDSDDNRWDIKKAVEYCEKAIKTFPESNGAQNCQNLLTSIKKPNIDITIEGQVLPNAASLALLERKNVKQAWFRILKMDYVKFAEDTWQKNAKEMALFLANEKPLLEWNLNLPDEGDFQQHAAEIQIPELDKGFYVLLASNNEKFNVDEMAFAWSQFWATRISYISQRNDITGNEFYVLDREKGTPIEEVLINAYTRDYDYQNRNYSVNLWNIFTSDKNGYFRIPNQIAKQKSTSISLEFIQGDDRLITGDRMFIGHFSGQEPKPMTRTFFFTDRAIYRPGQTVYYKAIGLEKTGDEYDILPGHSTKVEFYDVNYQLVSSQELSTNEYGSVSGSFIAPSGSLNGRMTIKNESGSTSVLVEEYKRPTFEVLFDPVKESYKLNEEVSVSGQVKAYAGNAVDGAKIKYRVVRNAYFPYRYFYYFRPFPASAETEITNGEMISGDDGSFTVTFKTIPDKEISKKFKPAFHYTIYATVTDISGETQLGEEMVAVGYEALFLDAKVPELLNQSGNNEFELEATNLNGEKQDVTVNIEISKLKSPEQLMVERLWKNPDEFLIAKDEFENEFPNHVYNDEDNPQKWEKEASVLSLQINTEQDSLLAIDGLANWEQGKYVIELRATDIYGNEVKSEKYFTVFNPAAKQPPLNTYNWFVPLKTKGEPGEEATFLIGTSAQNVKAIYEIQHKGEVIHREWIKLDREQKQITVPIKEEYRGNFSVQWAFVKDNLAYKNTSIIEVPYTNKKLDLAFETFRSDLEPGSKEKWTITIRDKNGDKLAAEMLASMYDASLDAFADHKWYFDLLSYYNSVLPWASGNNFNLSQGRTFSFSPDKYTPYHYQEYDQLNWFGFGAYGGVYLKGGREGMRNAMEGGAVPQQANVQMDGMEAMAEGESEGMVSNEEFASGQEIQSEDAKKEKSFPEIQVRRDFRETAFFYPELQTNENGDVVISCTLPESFTRWKFMGLAYSKDLKTGTLEKEFTASKKLMVMPNTPRFFRQGDTLYFTTKVVNLSDEKLGGSAKFEVFNTIDMKPVNEELQLQDVVKDFSIEKGQSTSVSWKIVIPEDFNVLTYQVKATAGNYTDGEEKTVPVLPNRMLVTESLPLPINGKETKDFTFDKLLKSDESSSLKNYRLTLEFASNPAWYAVQALPVISDAKYKNTISVFGSFFANSIAFYLAKSDPKIQRVFESWKNQSPESLLSNLEKNQELKTLILEQTPWVMQAQNEAERKQRIALLFDINNMQNRLDASIRQLEKLQTSNGGFSWFDGMPDSRYITQRIVEGFGKLEHIGILNIIGDDRIVRMMTAAVRYLDNRILEDYEYLKKHTDNLEEDHVSSTQIQYLYTRSFFKYIMINPSCEVAFNYYKMQAGLYWQPENSYLQGMIALALNRYDETEVPALIIKSLKERSLSNEEMGMYWRQDNGWFWYQAPVETQAMMIEAFDEVANDSKSVEKMKIWLLKQKQTQDWKTDRATVEAVYALLGRGTNLLQSDELVDIKVGDEKISKAQMGKVEAGTGYFQTSWSGSEIEADMGNIEVNKSDEGIAWGAVYWQYYEDLDKITSAETPLSLKKQLFVERNTAEGPVIKPIKDEDLLELGDKIKVRVELRVDRDMEYVHMQDMRASAFEPVNVISGYKYQGGLGYYESTRDASTDFFFDYLRKGTYVFEYTLLASQKGDFSNGITTIQCMYAPEFSSHSEGVRVKVE
jgi:hypothetical protein